MPITSEMINTPASLRSDLITISPESVITISGIRSSELEVKYTHKNQDHEASINAKWVGPRGDSAAFRIACSDGEVTITCISERCSPDRVAEIILRNALFGEKPQGVSRVVS